MQSTAAATTTALARQRQQQQQQQQQQRRQQQRLDYVKQQLAFVVIIITITLPLRLLELLVTAAATVAAEAGVGNIMRSLLSGVVDDNKNQQQQQEEEEEMSTTNTTTITTDTSTLVLKPGGGGGGTGGGVGVIREVVHHEGVNINDSESQEFKYRAGYWWSEKKSQKLSATELAALFAERQCQLVKIDLERPLEEQGPFSIIVHKISDILVKADQGDAVAKKSISAFESYVRKHPQMVILDPLDNNRALLDRYKQYRLIEQSGLAKEGVVFTPPFVHLTSTNIDVNRGRIRRSKITFPLVCKPTLAQGSTGAHQMCIIFNEAGLKDVKPPCVAQSFVNHNAKLFKLFVIKDKYYITERPSLKNFQAADQDTVFFYSHDISKPNSSSSLTELDETDKLRLEDLMSKIKSMNTSSSINGDGNMMSNKQNSNTGETFKDYNGINSKEMATRNLNSDGNAYVNEHGDSLNLSEQKQQNHDNNQTTNQFSPLMPSNERLNKIVKIFSEKLGLTFYGIDIIIENGTSRYAIIDMNTFPGYDGVENFLTIFRDVVCDAIPKDADNQNQILTKIKRKPTEIDSGIEST